MPSCLVEEWILSRFHHTVAEANDALNNYRFDQYARTVYDFFWRDFCDWYLEAIKPAMKDPMRAPQTAQVLASVLDASLRLLHPIIPFITETIWWRLNDVWPDRGLEELPCPASKRLIKAAWPSAGAIDERIEAQFVMLQEIIIAIRNLRNEHKVDPKKPVAVSIACSAEQASLLNNNRELIELLGTCEVKSAAAELPPPRDAARTTAVGCDIYIEGLVDAQAEQQRAGKRREELTKLIASMKGRLSNAGYIAKAPAHLVKQTQDQLAEAEAELAKLQ